MVTFVKDQTSVLHKPKVWYTCQQMEELFCFFWLMKPVLLILFRLCIIMKSSRHTAAGKSSASGVCEGVCGSDTCGWAEQTGKMWA